MNQLLGNSTGANKQILLTLGKKSNPGVQRLLSLIADKPTQDDHYALVVHPQN